MTTAFAVKKQSGFSLLSLLLAVVLLAVITLAFLSSFGSSYAALSEARCLELAKTLGQLKVEEAMANGSLTGTQNGTFDGLAGFSWTSTIVDQSINVTITYQAITGAKQYKVVGRRSTL